VSVKKNIGYNVLLTISNMIFPIISFPYAARILGPEGTGEVSFAQSFCQYFIIISALGIPLYGTREIAKINADLQKRSKLFIELNIIRLITSFFVLIPYFIIVFSVPKFYSSIELYLWGAFLILISSTSIEWFFGGLEDFKYITIRSVLIKVISIGALFLFVKTSSDVIPYFLIYVLTYVLGGFFNLKYALKFINISMVKLSELRFKVHIKPLFLIFSSFFAITVYVLLDTVLLGLISSDEAVGHYTVASRITKISLTLITSLGIVLVPKLSYAVSQDNLTEVSRIINRSMEFVMTFGIPMMTGLFVLAPELVLIFSGKEFSSAFVTLRILCPLILIIGMANIFSIQILTPLSKDKLVMQAAAIGAVVSLVLNLILIPIWNENGSAITNIIAEGTVTFFCYLFAKKFISFQISKRSIFLNIISTLPYWFIAEFIRKVTDSSIIVLVFTIPISILLFLIFNLYIVKNPVMINAVDNLKTRIAKLA
jgi:O-antigen/teichoic acid export membrane protein